MLWHRVNIQRILYCVQAVRFLEEYHLQDEEEEQLQQQV